MRAINRISLLCGVMLLAAACGDDGEGNRAVAPTATNTQAPPTATRTPTPDNRPLQKTDSLRPV